MNTEVAKTETQLPNILEDLSKFVLVGREKINSVRAEIRAIDKLQLAEEVRDQKLNEARMLSEAVLDAEVRLGDLLKQIPKVQGKRTDVEEPKSSTAPKFDPKSSVIKNLGFSKDQAKRFETLADNKDLVERVKVEARENDDIPTRTRVIDLAQQRKKKEKEDAEKEDNLNAYISECKKKAEQFTDAIYAFIHIDVDPTSLKMWGELMESRIAASLLKEIESDIEKLTVIRTYLKGVKK